MRKLKRALMYGLLLAGLSAVPVFAQEVSYANEPQVQVEQARFNFGVYYGRPYYYSPYYNYYPYRPYYYRYNYYPYNSYYNYWW